MEARTSTLLGSSHTRSMWALLPLKPWPPAPTTKPPPHRHSTAVQNFQEMGILGRAVITALKSDEREHRDSAKSEPKTPPPQPQSPQQKQESEEKQQLSGADVLMALQRATSKKAKKTKVTANSGAGKDDKSGKKNELYPDFSNVRPLSINAEWSDRLEELESRLQELLHI